MSATPSIFRPVFARLCEEFRTTRPDANMELTASARDQDDQIRSTLRRSLIGDLPDVSFEGLNHLRVLQARRIAVPLNGLIRNDVDWNDATYAPSVVESGRIDHTVVGLGAALSVPIIYYDIDVVASVSGSESLPQDWGGLLALVRQLAGRARRGTLGGFCQHDSSTWIFLALVEGLGGSMMNADESRITFDGPEGLRAMQIYQAFGRAGQARADMSREQARQAFAGGGIGLLVDSSSSLTQLERQVGGRFRLGTARIPLAPNGRVPAAGIAATLMCRDPAQQALAWQFAKFACGPRGQTIIGKSTGYFPANEVAMRRADLLGDYYAARPRVRPIVESLRFATRWYAFPGRNSARIDAVIREAVAAVVALEASPQEALAATRRTVQTLLSTHGGVVA